MKPKQAIENKQDQKKAVALDVSIVAESPHFALIEVQRPAKIVQLSDGNQANNIQPGELLNICEIALQNRMAVQQLMLAPGPKGGPVFLCMKIPDIQIRPPAEQELKKVNPSKAN